MQITGGKYNSRKIKTPDFENIKPTLSKTRQGIFNVLNSYINFEDKVFIDMFSGSGIMAFEAASRGFRVFVFEKDKKTALAIKENFKSFNLEYNLYFGDAIKNIIKIPVKSDVIFIDPPYDSDLYEKAIHTIKKENILNKNGIIILEHPVSKDINTDFLETIKIKTYGNKQITFLTNQEE